jgi:hypothetical protein
MARAAHHLLRLRLTEAEADGILRERISQGHGLRERLRYEPHRSSAVIALVEEWTDYNGTLLQRLFVGERFAIEYASTVHRHRIPAVGAPLDRRAAADASVEDQVSKLISILEQLPLLEVQPMNNDPNSQRADASPPRSVVINMHGGAIGQLNLGEVRGNINTHLNALAGRHAEDFARPVQILTDAISQDRGLDETKRAEALELIEFLSDSATQDTERRRPSLIKSALATLPLLVSGAKLAESAWTEHGRTIVEFFQQF